MVRIGGADTLHLKPGHMLCIGCTVHISTHALFFFCIRSVPKDFIVKKLNIEIQLFHLELYTVLYNNSNSFFLKRFLMIRYMQIRDLCGSLK